MHVIDNAKLNSMVSFLLEHANPSIVYHVKNDILSKITDWEKKELQNKVLKEKTIQKIMECQKEDGWLGDNLHGPRTNEDPYQNQEIGTKYLGEKLIFMDTPVLARAMQAFQYRDLSRFGVDSSRYAASGTDIIKAACIARAGYEEKIDISGEISISLESFQRVNEVSSVKDIVKIKKKRPERVNPEGIAYVFHDYEKWPCWYHLDILAHTKSWRSKENIALLADALNKLLKDNGLNYLPGYCIDIGHLVGCCGALPEGMKLGVKEGNTHFVLLNYVEYMCRCGLYQFIPQLKSEVDNIYHSIDEQGICRVYYCENALKGMGTYSGGQLEEDWKSSIRKQCDVTYRALLILNYSGRLYQ